MKRGRRNDVAALSPDVDARKEVGAVLDLGVLSPIEVRPSARDHPQGRRQGDIVSYPVPVADGATIDDANAVILVRYQGAVSAFSMRCPHKQTPLEWQPDNARFYCPKHKSTFQPEGTLIQGKATRN